MAQYLNGDDDYFQQFLDDISSLNDQRSTASLTKIERWSLKDIGDLVHATGYLSVGISAFRTAFVADNCEIRASWLRCVAVAYGVDIAAAAAQARYLLGQKEPESDRPHDWRILTVRPGYQRGSIDPDCLDSAQQAALCLALEAKSDWIAWSAGHVLAHTTPHWDTGQFFDMDRSNWKPRRARLFPLVAILASQNSTELLRKAVASDDPVYRQAAEFAVRARPRLDPGGEVARALSVDNDLTVRGEMDAGEPQPLHWSCNECGAVNHFEIVDCSGCKTGARPSRRASLPPG